MVHIDIFFRTNFNHHILLRISPALCLSLCPNPPPPAAISPGYCRPDLSVIDRSCGYLCGSGFVRRFLGSDAAVGDGLHECGGRGLAVGCERGQDVEYVDVCSSRGVRSSIIVFDAYEVATEGLPPMQKALRQIRSIILVHKHSGSRFAGYSLVCKSFSTLNL